MRNSPAIRSEDLRGKRLPAWNAARRAWHFARAAVAGPAWLSIDAPAPAAEDMPLCPACGGLLRDPILRANECREEKTTFPVLVECECGGCGARHWRVI